MWESPQENKDPKKWLGLSLYTRLNKNWQLWKNLPTKYVGRLMEDESYFNKVCLYQFFLALTPHS